MKKMISALLACVLACLGCMTGCTTDKPQTEQPSETVSVGQPTGTASPPAEEVIPEADMFGIYQSNISVSTGHNVVLRSEGNTPVTKTYRGVFNVQEYGEFEYCLYFTNCVESTQSNGSGTNAYRDMMTEEYRILSAYIGTVPEYAQKNKCDNFKAITFEGAAEKTVEPKEKFWSDPVELNVEEGELLVFEWTVEYTMIPTTADAKALFYSYEVTYSESGAITCTDTQNLPMPDLIGCDRQNHLRINFIGDSITQGFSADRGETWVEQISEGLGEKASVWNLGLGFARADDLRNSPSWLEKATKCDVVVICFGVNDINSGVYPNNTQVSAQQISDNIAYIARICKKAGCRVIIFTTPSYTWHTDAKRETWEDLVKLEKELAEKRGYDLFDFAACLGSATDTANPHYKPGNGHPITAGATAVAQAFLKSGLIGTE